MPIESRVLVSNHPNAISNNSTNSSFTMRLRTPINIPMDAKNCRVYCDSASVVNFFFNISSSLSNNIMYWTDNAGLPEKTTLTFPNGAYNGASDLNLFLKNYFTALGVTEQPIRFLEDLSQQKLILQLTTGYGVRFPNGISDILGWTDNTTIFNNTGTTYFYTADTSAKFNNVISLILNCSIASSAIYNAEYTNFVALIPINVPTGSLLNYTPLRPTLVNSNLAGTLINEITVSLTDQLQRVITIAEAWNTIITVEWD